MGSLPGIVQRRKATARAFRLQQARATLAGLLGLLAWCAAPALGQSPWYEGFESAHPSWRPAGGDAQFRLLLHERAQGEAHTGDRCEHVAISATAGTTVYLAHDVGQPLVIDELLPTVWVKSDRSGLQLLAQVVLPRTIDRRSGQPVSTLLAGGSYQNVGHWQQLRLDDLPRHLARQVRVLRTQLGPGVDDREAYVRDIVLNVYGGPGTTHTWIDDLDLRGHVARPQTALTSRTTMVGGPAGSGAADVPAAGKSATSRRVEMAGSVLLGDGRPFFPRLIQYRGEPLSLLAQLGFNGIWLQGPATGELLQEADRVGMWIVCRPPRPEGLELPYGPVQTPGELGPEFDRVLAWHLGDGLNENDVEITRRWSEIMRVAGRRLNRPLLAGPLAQLRAFSRYVDLLSFRQEPLGTSLELSDYGTWLRARPRLARPGTLFWTTVQTQFAPALVEQLVTLDPTRPVPNAPSPDQIRMTAYTAVGAGSRGLLFESYSPLSQPDPQTRQRAMTLELLNTELGLLEPWTTAGTPLATVAGTAAELGGAMLRAERKRLLLPLWLGRGAQYVPGQSAVNNVALVVPGVPESSTAYEILPGGLRPLKRERVSGGMQVSLEEFGVASAVLLAQDPLIVGTMSQHAAAAGPRAAQLQRELAAGKLQLVQQVAGELGRRGPPPVQIDQPLASARAQLQTCDAQFAARDFQGAYLSAERALRGLRAVERAYWEAAVGKRLSPAASPGLAAFSTLPWHGRLVERLSASRAGVNLLPAGDFEDLNVTMESGWQHFESRHQGVLAVAELMSGAAHSGRQGMRLSARAEDPKNPATLLETPALWITSPPVAVEAGQLLCIRAWVSIPKPLVGSVDGLSIVESLGGEPLAERIGQTHGWQEVVLYRQAVRSGPLELTFGLTGLGEVLLDDVTVQVIEPGQARAAIAMP